MKKWIEATYSDILKAWSFYFRLLKCTIYEALLVHLSQHVKLGNNDLLVTNFPCETDTIRILEYHLEGFSKVDFVSILWAPQ